MNIGYLFLGLSTAIFGSFEITVKLINDIGADQLNFLRFLIGGIALLPFTILQMSRKRIRVAPRQWVYLFLIGILFVPVSMTIYIAAIQKASASLSVFVFCSNPIFIAIFARFILKEKIGFLQVIALISGLAGLFLITKPGLGSISIYSLYALASGALFALYIVLSRRMTAQLGSLIPTNISILFGTAVLLVILGFRGTPVFHGFTGKNVLPLLYLGVFCSGITYFCFYSGVERTSVTTGSFVFFVKPIIATILAIVILGETVTIRFVIGALCILIGSAALIYASLRTNAQPLVSNSIDAS